MQKSSGKPKAFTVELNQARQYQRLMQAPATCGLKAGRVFLEPGTDCGVHSTQDREELLVFLSGRGRAVIAGEDFDIAAGRVCYIPPQTEHNIINTDSEPLVYVFCVVPV